ncbi:MAG: hypothetical protein QXR89_05600 [Candidatus Bathyarchaeia archaeon]
MDNRRRKTIKGPRLKSFKPTDIAAKMGKTKDAVLKKIERIGLKVVQPQSIGSTTTSELMMPKELPSVEET